MNPIIPPSRAGARVHQAQPPSHSDGATVEGPGEWPVGPLETSDWTRHRVVPGGSVAMLDRALVALKDQLASLHWNGSFTKTLVKDIYGGKGHLMGTAGYLTDQLTRVGALGDGWPTPEEVGATAQALVDRANKELGPGIAKPLEQIFKHVVAGVAGGGPTEWRRIKKRADALMPAPVVRALEPMLRGTAAARQLEELLSLHDDLLPHAEVTALGTLLKARGIEPRSVANDEALRRFEQVTLETGRDWNRLAAQLPRWITGHLPRGAKNLKPSPRYRAMREPKLDRPAIESLERDYRSALGLGEAPPADERQAAQRTQLLYALVHGLLDTMQLEGHPVGELRSFAILAAAAHPRNERAQGAADHRRLEAPLKALVLTLTSMESVPGS